MKGLVEFTEVILDNLWVCSSERLQKRSGGCAPPTLRVEDIVEDEETILARLRSVFIQTV